MHVRKYRAVRLPLGILAGVMLLTGVTITGCGKSATGSQGSGSAAENTTAGSGAANAPGSTEKAGDAAEDGTNGTETAETAADAAAAEDTGKVQEWTLQNFYFDTVISIKFYAGSNGKEMVSHLNEMCQKYQDLFSRTDPASELYQVNHRTEATVEVSPEIAELTQTGLEYYELSGGRFDITIAPVSDLWDFKSGATVLPDETKLKEAVAKVDASKVHVDGNELTFDSPDTMIDLGALAKGYVADAISDYLKGEGVTSGLINLGGNVLTIGDKPDGSKWKIGIQKPFDSTGGIEDAVTVSDMSVVSSGVYERFFKLDGVIYHHILDPATGYPVENGLWGDSIICDSSLQGDALSTTCFLMGVEDASKLIESLNEKAGESGQISAIFIDDNLKETKVGDVPD